MTTTAASLSPPTKLSDRPDELPAVLRHAQIRRATDVHIMAGSPILFRVDGSLQPFGEEVLSPERARTLSYALLDADEISRFERDHDLDVMTAAGGGRRYRVNVGVNQGAVGAVVRLLAAAPMPLDALRLPPTVRELTKATKGLILVTGSTSQGKTTTMAAIVDAINRRDCKHIITIEDPIEYVHEPKRSIVRQREVGKDTLTFKSGLRAALRQDPDVIVIGEMRDYDTIKIALTAAETGVLVLSTLHIISIDKIVDRLLSYAPDGSDGHLRTLLAESLRGIVHQELLPVRDGGKRVAAEILVVTAAVRNVLRRTVDPQLRVLVTAGRRHGMVPMEASLDELRAEGEISDELCDTVRRNYPQ